MNLSRAPSKAVEFTPGWFNRQREQVRKEIWRFHVHSRKQCADKPYQHTLNLNEDSHYEECVLLDKTNCRHPFTYLIVNNEDQSINCRLCNQKVDVKITTKV